MGSKKNADRKILIPALDRKCRIFLYVIMIFFAALSLSQVKNEFLPDICSYIIYVFAAVSLFASCIYIGKDIKTATNKIKRTVGRLADKNKIAKHLYDDYQFRTVVFTAGSLLFNMIFAVFNGAIGMMSRSAWYITLAVYYLMLGIMRFWTVSYGKRVSAMEQTQALRLKEIRIYRNCSILSILMTAVLGGMVILTVHSQGGKHYPGITIYVIALYTFIKVPMAVANRIKTAKMKSPLLVTIRNIGYADACVSVLSLQTAMFASFGGGMQDGSAVLMNEITGAVICMMVLALGIYGVYSSQSILYKAAERP